MRLIDADALALIEGKILFMGRHAGRMRTMANDAVRELVAHAPTVDAVKVVRCKDCAVPHNKWLGCPNLNGLVPPPDFYCARGERKDDSP